MLGAYWGSASSSGDRRALYRPTAWAKRWVPTSGTGATGTSSMLRRHLAGRRTSGAAGMPKWASSSASSIVKLGRVIVGERERQGARGGEGRKRRTPATRGEKERRGEGGVRADGGREALSIGRSGGWGGGCRRSMPVGSRAVKGRIRAGGGV